mmetsp:Transcript_102557/g.295296  ORF Transcript_102557/g.295296 Transcript_102557/m.295296 type:complete len:246 (+) Transcript_102557:618-1355(+)
MWSALRCRRPLRPAGSAHAVYGHSDGMRQRHRHGVAAVHAAAAAHAAGGRRDSQRLGASRARRLRVLDHSICPDCDRGRASRCRADAGPFDCAGGQCPSWAWWLQWLPRWWRRGGPAAVAGAVRVAGPAAGRRTCRHAPSGRRPRAPACGDPSELGARAGGNDERGCPISRGLAAVLHPVRGSMRAGLDPVRERQSAAATAAADATAATDATATAATVADAVAHAATAAVRRRRRRLREYDFRLR